MARKYQWKNYGYCSKHGFGSCKCLANIPMDERWAKCFQQRICDALWSGIPKKKSKKKSKSNPKESRNGRP